MPDIKSLDDSQLKKFKEYISGVVENEKDADELEKAKKILKSVKEELYARGYREMTWS